MRVVDGHGSKGIRTRRSSGCTHKVAALRILWISLLLKEQTNKQTHRIAKSPCLIKRICIITNLETKIIRESAVKAFISSALSIVSVKYYCSGKFEEWHAFNCQNKVFSIGQVYVEDLPKRTIKRTFYPIEEQKCTFQRGLQVCDYMLVDSEILTLIQQVIIYLITTTERNSNKFLKIQQKTLM